MHRESPEILSILRYFEELESGKFIAFSYMTLVGATYEKNTRNKLLRRQSK